MTSGSRASQRVTAHPPPEAWKECPQTRRCLSVLLHFPTPEHFHLGRGGNASLAFYGLRFPSYRPVRPETSVVEESILGPLSGSFGETSGS